MRRIWTVTWHTLFGAGARGYITILIVVLALDSLIAWPMIEDIGAAQAIPDKELATMLTRQLFTTLTTYTSYGLIFIGCVLGETITGEVTTKAVFITFTKISRWQFCLGVLFAGILLIAVLSLGLIAASYALGIFLGVNLSYLYFIGIVQKVSLSLSLACFSLALACCLSISSIFRLPVWILIYIYFIGAELTYPWRILYDAAYYLAPSTSKVDLIEEGLISSRLDFLLSLELMVVVENLLYSGFMLGLAIWGFSRREFGVEKVKES